MYDGSTLASGGAASTSDCEMAVRRMEKGGRMGLKVGRTKVSNSSITADARPSSLTSTEGNCVISPHGSILCVSLAVHSKSSTTRCVRGSGPCVKPLVTPPRPLTSRALGARSEPQPERATASALEETTAVEDATAELSKEEETAAALLMLLMLLLLRLLLLLVLRWSSRWPFTSPT